MDELLFQATLGFSIKHIVNASSNSLVIHNTSHEWAGLCKLYSMTKNLNQNQQYFCNKFPM